MRVASRAFAGKSMAMTMSLMCGHDHYVGEQLIPRGAKKNYWV